MRKKLWKVLWSPIYYTFFTFIFLLVGQPTAASASQPHYTMIINQVRGPGAFDPGNIDFFKRQVETLREEKLTGVFAIRYDAFNQDYAPILKLAVTNKNEIAALLEVTPELAGDSGVPYRATPENQYLSTHAYLLGYTPEDRQKLIDTYMARFKNFFGFLPRTTVGWMIDSYSLQYLSDRYQTVAHEITREQWNTDSATLIGGPPHYPYYPSLNWAMVPSQETKTMPLIIRQTITDPVENYGDFTDSHTSQPNDYDRRNANFSYFDYLFQQAHNQPLNPYTVAVVGLENSMAKQYQDEFIKQIEYISAWQKKSFDNHVVTVSDFMSNNPNINTYPQIYEGPTAWWITTPSYRIRLRLDNGILYISDIRIYNQDFTDPYFDAVATNGAFWVVPFLLDGSRFLSGDASYQYVLSPLPDPLGGRKSGWSIPTRIELQKNVTDVQVTQFGLQTNGKTLVSFSNDWFEIPDTAKFVLENPITGQVIRHLADKLEWTNFIGLSLERRGRLLRAIPWSDASQLDSQRAGQFPLLLPHLSVLSPDFNKSLLYVNNRYSVSGRNPIRFVFFPKDRSGYPAAINSAPIVTTDPPAKSITVGPQNWLNGTIYIDMFPNQPGEMKVNVRINDTDLTQTAYSSPDCKTKLLFCLLHPRYIWWYLHTLGR